MRKSPLTFFVFFVCVSTSNADLKWEKETVIVDGKADHAELFGVYKFENTAKRTVKIDEVTTSCSSCTEAHATKDVVAPGEKGEIQVVFHLSNAEDVKEKQIFVTTDDGLRKVLTLKIHVDEPIAFEPRRLTWQQGEKREGKTLGAQVLAGEVVGDLQVTSSSGAIKAEAKLVKEKGGKGKYEIVVTPAAGDTPANAWIRVEAKLKSGKTEAATFFVSVE